MVKRTPTCMTNRQPGTARGEPAPPTEQHNPPPPETTTHIVMCVQLCDRPPSFRYVRYLLQRMWPRAAAQASKAAVRLSDLESRHFPGPQGFDCVAADRPSTADPRTRAGRVLRTAPPYVLPPCEKGIPRNELVFNFFSRPSTSSRSRPRPCRGLALSSMRVSWPKGENSSISIG